MTRTLGSCDCGGVVFEITGRPAPVIACHCDQCRKSSGHFWASAAVAHANFAIKSDATLRWFQSTDVVRKGFCRGCGATLFWQLDGMDRIAVAAGALEMPTGTELDKHIFVAEKGDYYVIDDGLPQAAQFDLDAGEPAK